MRGFGRYEAVALALNYPQAAGALENQPMDHRKIILVVSDGTIVGPNEIRFDQNRTLLLLKQIEVYGVSTAFGTFGSFKAYEPMCDRVR